MVEVTPDKKVVWEIKGKVPGTDIELKWMTCLQEMEKWKFYRGQLSCRPGQSPDFFEITRDKKVVWEFNEFDLVGNGLACWQVLDGTQASKLPEKIIRNPVNLGNLFLKKP